jgi:hypothetical protein
LLAVAAGSTFGLTAALMKAMTRTLAGGIGDLLTAWPAYAMVAAGVRSKKACLLGVYAQEAVGSVPRVGADIRSLALPGAPAVTAGFWVHLGTGLVGRRARPLARRPWDRHDHVRKAGK